MKQCHHYDCHEKLPLPEDVYAGLRQEAERSKRPATSIAREAIEAWLHDCRKAARHQAIAEFARGFGGSELDLDPQLEAAAIEHLLDRSDIYLGAVLPEFPI